jgi:hypothetical protein
MLRNQPPPTKKYIYIYLYLLFPFGDLPAFTAHATYPFLPLLRTFYFFIFNIYKYFSFLSSMFPFYDIKSQELLQSMVGGLRRGENWEGRSRPMHTVECKEKKPTF